MKGWLVISAFVVLLGAASCNDQLACSAYQSYFILDNTNYPRNGYPLERAEGLEASRFDYPDISYHQIENPLRDEYYAYLDVDSFPKEVDVVKNQYGIVKKQRLRAHERALHTIPMEVNIPRAPDSILFAGDEELFAEMDQVDSAAVDSIRSMGYNYKYNIDQKYYLWYLRNKLVWEDELEDDQEEGTDEDVPKDEEVTEEKVGFFKRIIAKLFNKKKPEPAPAIDEVPEEEEVEENDEGF